MSELPLTHVQACRAIAQLLGITDTGPTPAPLADALAALKNLDAALVASYRLAVDDTSATIAAKLTAQHEAALPADLVAIGIFPEPDTRSVALRINHDAAASGATGQWPPEGDVAGIDKATADVMHLYAGSAVYVLLQVYARRP